MLTNYQNKLLTPANTKLIRPADPGTPTAVCPTCGVRGHVVVERGPYGVRQAVTGCRCGRPSEGKGTTHA